MSWLSQTIAVLALNIRTIPARLSSSAVAIVGIAGVVVVFVSVLSIAAGFSAAMQGSGSPNRALVMRSGADSEMTSGLSGPDVEIIKQAPGLLRNGQTALASAELYVIIDLPKRSTPDAPANVPMRGIEQTGMPLREEVSIIEGRMFQFGTNEVIVGRGARGQFIGTEVGNTIVSGQNRWQVVGVFESDGGVAETEIWADARTLQGAYRRGNTYQSLLARLESAESLDTFRDWLTANPQLNVSIKRENEYYASQSQALTRLITTIGYGIAGLMGIGAVFGAILTMYTAVATRSREIATLRALGIQHRFRAGVDSGGVPRARRDRRPHWRRGCLSGLQRLSDVDDELPDVQPGGVRFSGDPRAARHGIVLRPGHGTRRRTVSRDPRSSTADSNGVTRTLAAICRPDIRRSPPSNLQDFVGA